MKKTLMIILCIGVLLSVTACGTKVETEVPNADRILREKERKKIDDINKDKEEDKEVDEDAEGEESEATETEENEPEDQDNDDEDEDDKTEDTANEDEEDNAGSTGNNAELPYKKVNDTRYASTSLNVRSGPGTYYSTIGSLVRGQEVTRIGVTDNGWGVINLNGTDGYVSGDYLVKDKPADLGSTTAPVDDSATDSGNESNPEDESNSGNGAEDVDDTHVVDDAEDVVDSDTGDDADAVDDPGTEL